MADNVETKVEFSAEDFLAMQDQLAKATEQLSALAKDAEEAKAAKEALEEKVAAEKHEALVKEMFAGVKVEDSFVAMMAEADEDVASAVAEVLAAKQAQLNEALAGLTAPTENASSEHSEQEEPTTVDAAVNFIMSRDKCDIDEATDKVAKEFPALFN